MAVQQHEFIGILVVRAVKMCNGHQWGWWEWAWMHLIRVAPGTVTAGNASGISDGAGAIVVAGAEAVKTHGLTPIARVVSCVPLSPRPSQGFEEGTLKEQMEVARGAGLMLGALGAGLTNVSERVSGVGCGMGGLAAGAVDV